jgi:hypothetical protein
LRKTLKQGFSCRVKQLSAQNELQGFTIFPAMKISQFHKTGFLTFLIFIFSALPALGNPYYNSLPAPKREEIKIIDDHTVEIGIGPDNRSVSCNILDAVQSIPFVGPGVWPVTVYINNEKIHLYRNKLYTWDREGKYRVRLTTKYIREFGNIKIHIAEEKPLPLHEEEPEAIQTTEAKVYPLVVKEKPPAPPAPSSPPTPQNLKTGIVKGFRLAKFGMSEEQVIKAIFIDFGLLEKEIERRRNPESGQRFLTIASLTLEPQNGKAWMHYYFSSLNQTLNRVDVVWGHPEHSKVDLAVLQKSALRFKNLFSQFRLLKTQPPDPVMEKEPTIFSGVDGLGNGINMLWGKPLDKNFQPIPSSDPTLILSYFQP